MGKIGSRLWALLEKVMHFFVYRVFRIKLSEDKWQGFLQFVKFGLVGLSNVVVSYAIYLPVLLFFKKVGWLPNTDYLVAQLIGFFISVLWSFYLNRKFVFHDEDQHVSWWAALLKTYASYAFTGFFLNSVLSFLWVEVLNWSEFIAPIINLVINVPINFILNKFWAFRKRKKSAHEEQSTEEIQQKSEN